MNTPTLDPVTLGFTAEEPAPAASAPAAAFPRAVVMPAAPGGVAVPVAPGTTVPLPVGTPKGFYATTIELVGGLVTGTLAAVAAIVVAALVVVGVLAYQAEANANAETIRQLNVANAALKTELAAELNTPWWKLLFRADRWW